MKIFFGIFATIFAVALAAGDDKTKRNIYIWGFITSVVAMVLTELIPYLY